MNKPKLRLFALRPAAVGSQFIPDLYFSSKAEAKARRNDLGQDKYRVTYGPDHRHFSH